MNIIKTCLALSLFAAVTAQAQQTPARDSKLKVDAGVALSSVMALSDQHIENLVDSLRLLAANPDVQSGEWEKIKIPLETAAKLNVEALNWFVLPDGSYWSIQNGHESGNLTDRSYFPKLLQGKTVIGDLVVSKATGKSVAIVAVPVIRDKKVVGALGASIYLDKLSARLEKELNLDKTMIFYSFDQRPIVGLCWDPAIIFADPKKLGKAVSDAFDKMVTEKQGTVEYKFREKTRTVTFRKSDVTGWWYAFGQIPAGREKTGTRVG